MSSPVTKYFGSGSTVKLSCTMCYYCTNSKHVFYFTIGFCSLFLSEPSDGNLAKQFLSKGGVVSFSPASHTVVQASLKLIVKPRLASKSW